QETGGPNRRAHCPPHRGSAAAGSERKVGRTGIRGRKPLVRRQQPWWRRRCPHGRRVLPRTGKAIGVLADEPARSLDRWAHGCPTTNRGTSSPTGFRRGAPPRRGPAGGDRNGDGLLHVGSHGRSARGGPL